MMKYVEDNNLTEYQKEIKWNIYCEVEWETDSDITTIFKSLLADI